MFKPGKLLFAALLLLALVVLAAFLGYGREPRFQGRTLSQWLHTPPAVRFAADFGVSIEGQQAIRAIGTNAIPTALQWIRYEPSPLRQRLGNYTRWIPEKVRSQFFMSGYHRAMDAERLFWILGPDARGAIPELAHLAMTSKGEARVGRCARALTGIGVEAIPALAAIIQNPHGRDRGYVIERFLHFGAEAAPAVPTLLQALQDRDPRVAGFAATTLGMMRLSNSVVIPVLMTDLRSSSAWRRRAAADALARYGDAAKDAVPALRQLLADPEAGQSAAIALYYIAPEGMTNELQKTLGW